MHGKIDVSSGFLKFCRYNASMCVLGELTIDELGASHICS